MDENCRFDLLEVTKRSDPRATGVVRSPISERKQNPKTRSTVPPPAIDPVARPLAYSSTAATLNVIFSRMAGNIRSRYRCTSRAMRRKETCHASVTPTRIRRTCQGVTHSSLRGRPTAWRRRDERSMHSRWNAPIPRHDQDALPRCLPHANRESSARLSGQVTVLRVFRRITCH